MADSTTVDRLANNIAGIESAGSGGYNALGVVIPKSGDRAYGKYQIMGNNIPAWTKEATGVEATPEAFLANPDLQERTARFKMGQYYDQYGNDEDVASMWHAGVPYKQAVAEGRRDPLGTTTADYGKRVAGGGEPLIVTLPDGREIDLGVNPSAELQAQVRAKILADFPDLAPAASPTAPTAPAAAPQAAPTPVPGNQLDVASAPSAPSPMSTEQSFDVASTTPPPAPTVAFPSPAPAPPHARTAPPVAAERPMRELHPDEAAIEMNQAMGLRADHPYGRYSAMIGKPVMDALTDIFGGAFGVAPGKGGAFSPEAPAGGDPTKLATYLDAAGRAGKLLHGIAVPAEIAGNVTNELLIDAGAPPELSGAVATIVSVFAGAKTPGIEAPPETAPWYRHTAPPRARMPLQGTATSRAAARETSGLATQAEEAAANARVVADDAERAAEEAAGRVQPSPALRERAAAEVTPTGTAPVEGSVGTTRELGRQLEEVRTPTKAIYDALVDKMETETEHATRAGVSRMRSLDPSQYQGWSEKLAALRDELGPTLQGEAKAVVDDVESAVNSGQRLSYKQLDAYKQQLDTLFPTGKMARDATPRQRMLNDLKWDVRDKMRSLLDGEDREWAEAADAMYRDEIVGRNRPYAIGNLARLAEKNPATFVERVLGRGTTDKQATYADAILKRLDANAPEKAAALREAVAARALDDATDSATGALDPKKLLGAVGKYKKQFYDAVVSKEAHTLYQTMSHELGDVGASAEAAKRGAKWAAAAGAEATGMRGAAEAAATEATKPNRLAKFVAGGVELGAVGLAGKVAGPWAAAYTAGALGAGRMAGIYIPRFALAKIIADSKSANLLARALRTGIDSPAAITILEELRNRGTSVGWLGHPTRKEEGATP